jgi:hypothetical protein
MCFPYNKNKVFRLGIKKVPSFGRHSFGIIGIRLQN